MSYLMNATFSEADRPPQFNQGRYISIRGRNIENSRFKNHAQNHSFLVKKCLNRLKIRDWPLIFNRIKLFSPNIEISNTLEHPCLTGPSKSTPRKTPSKNGFKIDVPKQKRIWKPPPQAIGTKIVSPSKFSPDPKHPRTTWNYSHRGKSHSQDDLKKKWKYETL